MDRPGFESQLVSTLYIFSKCPESLRNHSVFYSIGTGQLTEGKTAGA